MESNSTKSVIDPLYERLCDSSPAEIRAIAKSDSRMYDAFKREESFLHNKSIALISKISDAIERRALLFAGEGIFGIAKREDHTAKLKPSGSSITTRADSVAHFEYCEEKQDKWRIVYANQGQKEVEESLLLGIERDVSAETAHVGPNGRRDMYAFIISAISCAFEVYPQNEQFVAQVITRLIGVEKDDAARASLIRVTSAAVEFPLSAAFVRKG